MTGEYLDQPLGTFSRIDPIFLGTIKSAYFFFLRTFSRMHPIFLRTLGRKKKNVIRAPVLLALFTQSCVYLQEIF